MAQNNSFPQDEDEPLSLSQAFEQMRERAAALEHEQWVQWSKTIAASENISPERLDRWKKLWVPYDQLTEEQKEQDRKWADKGIEIYASFACEV